MLDSVGDILCLACSRGCFCSQVGVFFGSLFFFSNFVAATAITATASNPDSVFSTPSNCQTFYENSAGER